MKTSRGLRGWRPAPLRPLPVGRSGLPRHPEVSRQARLSTAKLQTKKLEIQSLSQAVS